MVFFASCSHDDDPVLQLRFRFVAGAYAQSDLEVSHVTGYILYSCVAEDLNQLVRVHFFDQSSQDFLGIVVVQCVLNLAEETTKFLLFLHQVDFEALLR